MVKLGMGEMYVKAILIELVPFGRIEPPCLRKLPQKEVR